jgi:hypothetical protein
MYKVGDKVRILHTDYPHMGLDFGSVHDVVNVGVGRVMLENYSGVWCCFYFEEVEPYPEPITHPTADHWKDIADALRAGIELAIENADYDRAIDLARKLDAIPMQ